MRWVIGPLNQENETKAGRATPRSLLHAPLHHCASLVTISSNRRQEVLIFSDDVLSRPREIWRAAASPARTLPPLSIGRAPEQIRLRLPNSLFSNHVTKHRISQLRLKPGAFRRHNSARVCD